MILSVRTLAFLAITAFTALPGVSIAVVIAGPDGLTNTTPPSPDPGFANVGRRGALSGVYLRNGWVLTANHVGEGTITLNGMLFDPVPGSGVRIENPMPPHPDLFAFKLVERPVLPDLNLPSGPRMLGEPLIMIGNGQDRAAGISWTSPDGTTFDGWSLSSTRTFRWGTNFVEATDLLILDTQTFGSVFEDLSGPSRNAPEAQAVAGDSGGAAFYWNGSTPELVGIMYARSSTTEEQNTQPAMTALFENATLIADLYFYRDEITALIDQPDCDDGLDEDGDGQIDFPDDPGCVSALDDSEREASLVCDNGIDDDLDGLIDFPEDDGCSDLLDADEVPEPSFVLTLALGSAAIAVRRKRGQAGLRAGRRTRI